MNQKSLLITGCSSGIGLCLARGLKERGYRVFASARKEDDVAMLRAEGLETLRLNLADSGSIQQAVHTMLEQTGGTLYGLINNGAYAQPGAVEDLTRDILRQQFETNVFGTHELTTLLLPVMRRQGEGRVVQISSLLGYACLAYRGAYNASKFALEGLSDTLRLELRDSNIHISLIEPGAIKSRFRENAYAAYKAHIDRDRSAHRHKYLAMEARLEGRKGPMPFKLGPEAVLEKVIHALEASRPRARYPVTFPAHLFWWLRRLLPVRWFDAFLDRVGDDSRR